MGTFIVRGASSGGVNPPFFANVQHWWDFTDPATVFSDVAGTILAGEGDPIRNVTNKGTDGQPLVEAGAAVPEYNLAFINGLNVATNVGGNTLTTILNNALSTTGLTAVIVLRSQDVGGSPNPLNWSFGGNDSLMQADIAGSGNWEIIYDPADERDTLKLVVPDEFIWLYGAIAENFFIDYRASGGNLQTGTSGYPVTDAGLTINIADFIGNVAEVIIYDEKLSAAEQSGLIQYLDKKYDGLPQIISPPPALLPPFLPNLQHWWDFTDPAQVFQDIAGLTPCTDGTILQRVNDKGTALDDLQDAGSGITWHTGVVNGLPVTRNTVVQAPARFTSQALATTVGFSGLTYSSVKRHFNVPGGQGIMHAIDNGPSEVTQESGFGTWAEDHPNSGTTFSNKAVVPNEWVEHTMSDGNPAGYIQHVSGSVDVTAGQNFALQAGTPVEIFAQSVDGEIGEILVYDIGLTAAMLLTLQAYYDTKYLALPHL